MSGYLPPGCTQNECDRAQPGYWDDEAPEQWFTCEACDGEGITRHRISVYEYGCGLPHDDVDERTCEHCGGAGGFIAEAEIDRR